MNSYLNLKLIGEGSYGKVYSGTKGGVKYAIKQDKRPLSQSYLREIATLRTIGKDPRVGLISYEEFIPEDSAIVLEFMNTDLFSELDQGYIKSDKGSIADLLFGMKYLHSHGIMHRDIKEDNILCTGNNNDVMCLTDFGISRWIGGGGITLTPQIFPRELSPPEIILGSRSYSYSSDIWCLGIVILEMYLGEILPFPSDKSTIRERLGFLEKFTKSPYYSGVTKIEEYYNNGRLTKDQYNLVRKMLAYDPLDRPSANQLLIDLGYKLEPMSNYNSIILENLLKLDTIEEMSLDSPSRSESNMDISYEEPLDNRLFLADLFHDKKVKPDTIHLAIRYYDITGVNIKVCEELAYRINEVVHYPNIGLNREIIKLIKLLDYQLYQPTIINVYRLYSNRIYTLDLKLLNKVAVSGIANRYGINRVVKSIINDNDIIRQLINLPDIPSL